MDELKTTTENIIDSFKTHNFQLLLIKKEKNMKDILKMEKKMGKEKCMTKMEKLSVLEFGSMIN